LELEGEKARPLLGLKIGDTIDGLAIGLSGKLKLTGGVDRSGFPMKKGVHGAVKAHILVGRTNKGKRRRVTVRGEMVSEDSYQLNFAKVFAEPEVVRKEEVAEKT
jgi:small subunit ribosomal protein S6e